MCIRRGLGLHRLFACSGRVTSPALSNTILAAYLCTQQCLALVRTDLFKSVVLSAVCVPIFNVCCPEAWSDQQGHFRTSYIWFFQHHECYQLSG